ncbi:hypothetical protein N8I84_02745 [Streptomyces cynarae]|uniref:Uncharacterized protein n=1 Tax=Streptomyces cynarae TaxID=2981134 RepID=A0ABY6DTS2_9ACTN|nr:hypothetical protein [Streptomyces cynarae]UXY17775.1 hypothetical protein N8I84_02745 [Streptomyces cynarae]
MTKTGYFIGLSGSIGGLVTYVTTVRPALTGSSVRPALRGSSDAADNVAVLRSARIRLCRNRRGDGNGPDGDDGGLVSL